MNLQVSKTTALYIEALKEANTLYDKVLKAADEYSGNEGGDELLAQGFNEAYNAMTKEIYILLNKNINENVCTIGGNEI